MSDLKYLPLPTIKNELDRENWLIVKSKRFYKADSGFKKGELLTKLALKAYNSETNNAFKSSKVIFKPFNTKTNIIFKKNKK